MDFLRKLAPLALVAAVACSDAVPSSSPPRDRFYFPSGIALTRLSNGDAGLVVASSNFDLQFDASNGGTVIVVDVDDTLAKADPAAGPAQHIAPPTVVGSARIGSFGGEVAIVDDATCPGWTSGLARPVTALVASRSLNQLFAVPLAPGSAPGGLTCDGRGGGLDCPVLDLDPTATDPYGVTVACEGGAPGTPPTSAYAFVTYLRTTASQGLVTRVNLLAASQGKLLPASVDTTVPPMDFLGPPTSSSAFSPGLAGDATHPAIPPRLFVTSRFAVLDTTPLRWADLSDGGFAVGSAFLIDPVVRGADMRGLALSSPGLPRRAYVALRLFDVDLAASIGVRPPTDTGGALAVIDLDEKPAGGPRLAVLDVVPIGRGANEVRVVPRQDTAGNPLPDLVAVASTDDGTVSLYDAATGAVAKVFALERSDPAAPPVGDGRCDEGVPPPCPLGAPQMGKQPFALAVEAPFTRAGVQDAAGKPVPLARLYVGSFDRSWVNVVEIDPLNPAARQVNGAALRWDRIGAER